MIVRGSGKLKTTTGFDVKMKKAVHHLTKKEQHVELKITINTETEHSSNTRQPQTRTTKQKP